MLSRRLWIRIIGIALFVTILTAALGLVPQEHLGGSITIRGGATFNAAPTEASYHDEYVTFTKCRVLVDYGAIVAPPLRLRQSVHATTSDPLELVERRTETRPKLPDGGSVDRLGRFELAVTISSGWPFRWRHVLHAIPNFPLDPGDLVFTERTNNYWAFLGSWAVNFIFVLSARYLPRAVQAFLWVRANRCAACGYSLAGSRSERCPECGSHKFRLFPLTRNL